jgi:signal transduction histidine kinase
MPPTIAPPNPWPARWQRFSAATVRGFHTYAGWLVGISWRRFVVLSVLLLISAALLQNIPPFSWSYTTRTPNLANIDLSSGEPPEPPAVPEPAAKPAAPAASHAGTVVEKLGKRGADIHVRIDESGVHVTTTPKAAAPAASGASAAALAASDATSAVVNEDGIEIHLPANADRESVREALREARDLMRDAVREARDAAREQAKASAEAAREVANARRAVQNEQYTVHEVSLGEFLPPLAMLWIVASAIIKITYKQQIKAEAQAAQAVETAEAESLKRQVVEARMAAMQAQVEPHFLFNTLASIDHLIEVDPQRASQMQKNLIALLRASMPTMREANDGAVRDLGRELAVIRPYLEILKVRMEERLATTIDVPEGLLSAEFPPMMVQTLVENAIKHGLEPKPEGGQLSLKAEIVHGKLCVTVADTGLGFGRAATAGTGVGLANIRERLQLLYGTKASLTITENPGGGTRVAIAVPYKPVGNAAA